MSDQRKKTIFVVLLQLVLIVLFVILKGESGTVWNNYYQSYFADIVIPFGFYFLLVLNESKVDFFQNDWTKALSIFALCSLSEILQFFGIFALARVFDPVDFAMYGLGVVLAVICHKYVFGRIFLFLER